MNKKYIWGSILVVLIVIIGIAARNRSPIAQQSGKLQVVTSFYPLYFFASEIAGNKAEIVNITPAGAEPHEYEPTANDIAKITTSKLLLLNGGGLEAWGKDIEQNVDKNYTAIVVAGEGLTDRTVMEEGENITDPHVWLAPELSESMVDKITTGFTQADPQNKDYYLDNANALKAKLEQLDTTFHAGLSNCKERNIITSHAAFGYLAAHYNLNQVSITGISPDAEPSPKQLADIAKFAKSNNVKYIFFESLVSPKLAETIATEIGAQTLVLNPIEGLTSEEVAAGKNYFTEMEKNLTNLEIALECKTT